MSATLTHNGLPDGMTRWQLIDMLETGRRVLGLSKGAVAYLRFGLTWTQDADYQAGRVCANWTSVAKWAAAPKVEMDRRQISRIERELVDRTFIAKTCSDHSRRHGVRTKGVIKHAFGINFAPLINRIEEIQAAAKTSLFQQRETEVLRHRIKVIFQEVRNLGDPDAMVAAQEILPNRKPSTVQNFSRLVNICDALEAVLADFSIDAGGGEKSHQTDISPPPITKKEKKSKTCRAEKVHKSQPLHVTPALALLLASAEFREIIAFYAQGEAGGAPNWLGMEMAARDRAHQLGITTGVWQRQCEILGSERAVLCLLVADHNAGRSDKYAVRDAAGAFISMVRNEARQRVVLDRLLGELVQFTVNGSDMAIHTIRRTCHR